MGPGREQVGARSAALTRVMAQHLRWPVKNSVMQIAGRTRPLTTPFVLSTVPDLASALATDRSRLAPSPVRSLCHEGNRPQPRPARTIAKATSRSPRPRPASATARYRIRPRGVTPPRGDRRARSWFNPAVSTRRVGARATAGAELERHGRRHSPECWKPFKAVGANGPGFDQADGAESGTAPF